MKQIFSTIVFVIIISNTLFSQSRQERRERIKSLKIAFITEKLNLTNEEAQKFWPIYNKFEDDFEEIRRELQKIKSDYDIESISEDEANSVLGEISALETQRHELNKRYLNELMSAISAKKTIMLKEAEQAFNRRMIQEFRRRRQEHKSKN